ncbi:hypothetical protein O6H91_13G067800 [Diphasiastrum complanatum]|uniref:Uncharacterized protein n=1 Tax=Diphasiastrum complanatum TaxID=34168 RepID=A0ACC2BVS9_DIPCM|nr:hypothetical protein O6H91_13G067800 [Diphasiastrum complanatum]
MEEQWAGAIAAILSAIFFGSYAVPIKMPAVMAAQIDPVIFQAYKSFACFATSWLVLLNVTFRFTWWGIFGAVLWVINGVGAIMAVRLAGIATAQSLWSGLSIFVSYLWGAYFFKEPIKNPPATFFALVTMAVGMAGVAFAASGGGNFGISLRKCQKAFASNGPREDEKRNFPKSSFIVVEDRTLKPDSDFGKLKSSKERRFWNGVLCAAFVGIMNGSFMIPLKYAKKDFTGLEYLVSFGLGAMIGAIMIIAVYFSVLLYLGRPRPSFQFRVAAAPALLTGLCWSAGNFCSIYAILYLGLALGWPLVQCQILVSAMWAIFYFEETSSKSSAVLLLGSTFLVVLGAIILSKYGQ